MIIGIAGAAGAGKDTIASWLHTEKKFDIYHLADPIKEGLNAIFNWPMKNWDDREWKEFSGNFFGASPRRMAQTLGTEWRDLINPNLWLIIAEQRNDLNNPDIKLVIPDIRFPHEQDWIHKQGGIILYVTRRAEYTVARHTSESSLDITKVDIHIKNDLSIIELRSDLHYIWSSEIEEH